MKFEITKIFRFEAGHRVWKQNLAEGKAAVLSGNMCIDNKCRNLHGHSYILEVTVGSDTLNEQDVVVDFYHIKNALKRLVDDVFDHSFIIDKNDPFYPIFKEHFGHLKLTELDFCPTAEALAKYFYDYLVEKLKEVNLQEDIKVVQITLWETATGKATYRGE